MEFQRSSGVLIHVSSLPSQRGIGNLGPAAPKFAEFLAVAKQHVWEVLSDWGWIDGNRVAGLAGASGNVNFDEVEKQKLPLLYEAAGNFLDRGSSDARYTAQWQDFGDYCRAQADWLDDYALYAELRRQFNTGACTQSPEPLRRRQPDALRTAAANHGIRILGDVAIFVNMDSADVWTHPDIFELDKDLNPIHIAGVPPDYFSPTGQRWGNPLYKWDVLEERGFDWWIDRVRRACQLYDIVRLDHFRGFEAYWSIPANEETAINGQWVKATGLKLFRALEACLLYT